MKEEDRTNVDYWILVLSVLAQETLEAKYQRKRVELVESLQDCLNTIKRLVNGR